jgi:poly(3-hydroxybutyrate) depolymerase
MPIGEFGSETGGFMLSTPMYWFYEMAHATLNPTRALADAMRLYMRSPIIPLSFTTFGKTIAAASEIFERGTRRYGRPEWRIDSTILDRGEQVPVQIDTVWERPFCRLIHFNRLTDRSVSKPQPKILIVAPMAGHYSTVLRSMVQTLLPKYEIYVSEWLDARMVPVSDGRFDLDDYIDYVVAILHHLSRETHIVAVCQSVVPVLAAVSLMEASDDPCVPLSMTLIGGPIDTRLSPTTCNKTVQQRGTDWFRRNVITKVPFPYAGFMRDVYPGFLQINAYMSLYLDRHIEAHKDLFLWLVEGDGDSARDHREFYDEYLAVMDLTAEFYLQTIDTVFVTHALPRGTMTHRGVRIDPSCIRRVALMTVEGEYDTISGVGQTRAAHNMCLSIPDDWKAHYQQEAAGHYGIFNGAVFRSGVAQQLDRFILLHDKRAQRPVPSRKVKRGPSIAPNAAQNLRAARRKSSLPTIN